MTRNTSVIWDAARAEVAQWRPPALEINAARRADEFVAHDFRIAMKVVSLARWRRSGDERIYAAIQDVRAALERLINAFAAAHRRDWTPSSDDIVNAEIVEDAS